MRASEEREILERLAERLKLHIRFAGPEVLYEWSLILRVLYLTHMDKEYYKVLGLLKDYLDGKLDFSTLIKKLKEIEAAYEKQEETEDLPAINLYLDELL